MYARLVGAWVLLPLFFLVTGGSLDWWEAWAFCALLLVPATAFVLRMARKDPEFLERRMQFKEKEKTQRHVVAWGVPLAIAIFAVPGLDHRFGWTAPPLLAILIAQALVLASYLVVLDVFRVNRWAARTVGTMPGQQVISTGPYALVRHPMYAASIVLYLASSVALGSWWGMLPGALYAPLLIVRIRNEEEVLVRQLPGYEEYRKTVRFKLVPHLW